MWLALLRRFWQPLVALAAAGLIWWGVHSYGAQRFQAGYNQARSEDAKALAEWEKKLAAEVAANEIRLAYANRQHEIELAQLAARAARPLPRVVCHADESDPGTVSAAPGVPADGGAAAGVVQSGAGVHPDITPALVLLARRADRLSADARRLNSAVHGSR